MALELISLRRTCRQFDPNYIIPKNIIEQILKAGQSSQSGYNNQGINCHCMTKKEKIDSIIENLLKTWKPISFKIKKQRMKDYNVKNVVTADATSLFLLYKNQRASGKLTLIDT
jgi:nitroreductase